MMIDSWRPLRNQHHASWKNARSAYCYKMPVHDPWKTLQNDPRNPFFKKHKSPHSVEEMCRGIDMVYHGILYVASSNKQQKQQKQTFQTPFQSVRFEVPTTVFSQKIKAKIQGTKVPAWLVADHQYRRCTVAWRLNHLCLRGKKWWFSWGFCLFGTHPWEWYIYLHLVDFYGKCRCIYIYTVHGSCGVYIYTRSVGFLQVWDKKEKQEQKWYDSRCGILMIIKLPSPNDLSTDGTPHKNGITHRIHVRYIYIHLHLP